ncbi:MAG: hypothetical protein IIX67_00470, partial [Clostridia bacterium]|nr:hypothetical protein [Clostridia bacterium]
MRTDGAYKWLFFVNAKKYDMADVVRPKSITVKVKGEYAPKLYDTIKNGNREEMCEMMRLSTARRKKFNKPKKIGETP